MSTISPAPGVSRRSIVLIGVAVAAVAVIGLVAALITGNNDKSVATAATVEMGTVAVTGAALADLPETGTDPAIGKKAPAIVGQTFDGSVQRITPGSGPMVVLFVAHWCPHCQREVPRITDWVKAGLANGVALQAVATGTDAKLPNYPPSSWLEGEGWTIPTLADDGETSAAAAYGLTSFPYFVALDSSGKVTARTSGELTEDQFTKLLATTKS